MLAGCGEPMRLPRMVVADDPVLLRIGTVATDWAIVARRKNRYGPWQLHDEDEWEPEGFESLLYGEGTVAEGFYVDGKREGHWVIHQGWTVEEGFYVDGKREGHWARRYPAGTVIAEGPYVDGERNGYWVVKRANVVPEVSLGIGKDGRWFTKWADGTIPEGAWEFSFPDLPHSRIGHWVVKRADGTVEEGLIVPKDKTNGWVLKRADGSCEVVKFKAGVRVNTTDC